MERVIFHCDLNSYFASVEIMLNPELKGKPVAVCGKAEDRHGIVLAKSDQAKRCGVLTGEVIWQAKQKCPELIIVEPHYEQYAKYSRFANIVYSRYTDVIERFGIDEAWLDMTSVMRLYGNDPYKVADEIRRTIKRELGLTISIGVSFNKIFAKLGSDMKKPDAITVISKEEFKDKIFHLDVSELFGIGRSAKRNLNSLGIFTIGDLANASPEFMQNRFGISGLKMWRYANGFDNSPVCNVDEQSVIKSVGHGTTAIRDLKNLDDVKCMIYDLSQDVSHRLRKYGLFANGVRLSVRDCDLNVRQLQCPMEIPTQSFYELADKSFDMFVSSYEFEKPIRSVSVCAINLDSMYKSVQLNFNVDIQKHIKRDKIENTMEKIRDRFGNNAVNMCRLMTNDLTARNGTKTALPCAFSHLKE